MLTCYGKTVCRKAGRSSHLMSTWLAGAWQTAAALTRAWLCYRQVHGSVAGGHRAIHDSHGCGTQHCRSLLRQKQTRIDSNRLMMMMMFFSLIIIIVVWWEVHDVRWQVWLAQIRRQHKNDNTHTRTFVCLFNRLRIIFPLFSFFSQLLLRHIIPVCVF